MTDPSLLTITTGSAEPLCRQPVEQVRRRVAAGHGRARRVNDRVALLRSPGCSA